jgi:peptidoglycan/xylan/chitin deacetylase (PgdA/CDA1 family)
MIHINKLPKQIVHLAVRAFYYVGALKVINAIAARFRLAKRAGQLSFPFVRRALSRDFQILVYHRINNDRDPYFPATPVSVFSKQMHYLASSYTILSVEEAVSRSVSNDIPPNAIVVTFDDGYRDNYLYAFPILKRCGIPATIFLATDAIGSGNRLWHDEVFAAFRETRSTVLEGFFDGESTVRPLTTLGDRLNAQDQVLSRLKYFGREERTRHIRRLRERLGVGNRTRDRELMLTWDQVREMSRFGISFGSHTVSHPILSTLDEESANFEIVESKRKIEKEIHTPVRSFAYPNGTHRDFTERTKVLVRDAGYDCAVTTIAGSNSRGCDVFALRRATPWDEDIFSFGLRLSYYKLCNGVNSSVRDADICI